MTKTLLIDRPAKTRDEIVLTLFDLFRRAGYEAVSIADISAATGLGKSSLYHYFPGGKPDMAQAVADYTRDFMREKLLAPLSAPEPIETRIDRMMAFVKDMYNGGGAPCLIATMMISPTASPKAIDTMRAIVSDWIGALRDALVSAGVGRDLAKWRATAALIAIQGALIVGRATGEEKIFTDALAAARRDLLDMKP